MVAIHEGTLTLAALFVLDVNAEKLYRHFVHTVMIAFERATILTAPRRLAAPHSHSSQAAGGSTDLAQIHTKIKSQSKINYANKEFAKTYAPNVVWHGPCPTVSGSDCPVDADALTAASSSITRSGHCTNILYVHQPVKLHEQMGRLPIMRVQKVQVACTIGAKQTLQRSK